MKKEILLGFIVAIITTFISMYLYTRFISNNDFLVTIGEARRGGFLHKILTLSALPNLLVFFVFLNTNKEYKARGVLLATIFIALTTLILKFV